jgi:hypothetical protein
MSDDVDLEYVYPPKAEGVKMLDKDFVRLLLQPGDRTLLERLTENEGDASMSAVVRKLIRAEAHRRGLAAMPVLAEAPANGEHAAYE